MNIAKVFAATQSAIESCIVFLKRSRVSQRSHASIDSYPCFPLVRGTWGISPFSPHSMRNITLHIFSKNAFLVHQITILVSVVSLLLTECETQREVILLLLTKYHAKNKKYALRPVYIFQIINNKMIK